MSEVKVIPVFQKRKTDQFEALREDTRELLETLIKKMVDEPERVRVRFMVGDKTTVFMVECCKSSLGRLIGAGGKNIMGLRHIIASIMAKNGLRSIIEIPYFRNDE